jgi:hypothetical protein
MRRTYSTRAGSGSGGSSLWDAGLSPARTVCRTCWWINRKPHLFNRDQLAEILRPPRLMDGFEIAVDLIDDAAAKLNFQHKPLDIFIATIFLQSERNSFRLSGANSGRDLAMTVRAIH